MPKVSVVPGLKRGGGDGLRRESGRRARGQSCRRRLERRQSRHQDGEDRGTRGVEGGVDGRRGRRRAGAKFGAAVGSVAAKGTVYGVIAGIKGGVRAGVAAGEIAVRGTVLAGNVVAGAPTYAWQSASKVRSFVRLAAVQAEAALDPVAPKTRSAVKSKGRVRAAEAEALETSCFHREGVREIVRGHRAGGEAVCHPLATKRVATLSGDRSDPSSRERPTDRARLSLSRGLGSPRRRHSTSLERTCEHRTPRAVRPERIARHGADQLRDDGGGHRGGGEPYASRRSQLDVHAATKHAPSMRSWMEEAAADVKPGEQTKLPGADKKPPHKDPSA